MSWSEVATQVCSRPRINLKIKDSILFLMAVYPLGLEAGKNSALAPPPTSTMRTRARSDPKSDSLLGARAWRYEESSASTTAANHYWYQASLRHFSVQTRDVAKPRPSVDCAPASRPMALCSSKNTKFLT